MKHFMTAKSCASLETVSAKLGSSLVAASN
jgi:hypothetical protein